MSHRVIIQSECGMSEARCECGWHECVEHPEPKTIEEICKMIGQHRYDAGILMSEKEMHEAIDGLYAYDSGCVDSGIHDTVLKSRLREHLLFLKRRHVSAFETKVYEIGISLYGTEEAAKQGFTIEDIHGVVNWMKELMEES